MLQQLGSAVFFALGVLVTLAGVFVQTVADGPPAANKQYRAMTLSDRLFFVVAGLFVCVVSALKLHW